MYSLQREEAEYEMPWEEVDGLDVQFLPEVKRIFGERRTPLITKFGSNSGGVVGFA